MRSTLSAGASMSDAQFDSFAAEVVAPSDSSAVQVPPSCGATRRAFMATAVAFAAGCRSPGSAREPVAVPLLYDQTGTLLVAARVADRAEHRFVLDTGASRSLLATRCAEALALPLHDGGVVEGTAGTVNARATNAAIEVPGLESLVIDFTVYDFANHDAQCAGILGAELLRRAPFRLYYRDGRLLWGARRPENLVPMRLENGIPRITVAVGEIRLSVRIDTGASLPPGEGAYLNVTEAQARQLGLSGRPIAVWSATGTGGAMLELPVHRLPGLTIGSRS